MSEKELYINFDKNNAVVEDKMNYYELRSMQKRLGRLLEPSRTFLKIDIRAGQGKFEDWELSNL